jgi:hypothetical protein
VNTRARHFVLLTLGLAIGLTGGLALLNYLVDPYNRYGLNRLGVYISADREYKSTEVRRYPHNALLLGNSRMAVIPPDRLNGFRFFNGAFAGASAEEVYYFVEHYAQKQELVILGVDLGTYDPPQLKGDIFAPPTCGSVVNNLFNLQTVEYSFRTISDHLAGIPSPMHPDGGFDMAFWVKNADVANPPYLNFQLEQLKRGCDSFALAPKERLSFYARIARCLQERGIPCVVLVPPLHEAVAQHVQATPARVAAYQAWKQQLNAIFPRIVDVSFSAYGAAGNFFRSDPAHFRAEVGVQILNTEVMPVALRLLQERTNRLAAVRAGAP